LRVRERGVAEPAGAAARCGEAGPDTHEVGEHGAVLVHDHGAVGHGQDEVLAVRAMAEIALAEVAAGRALMRLVVVLEQRRGRGVDLEDHVTATAAVGAVGARQRLELLAADRGGAVPAGTADDLQADAVDECGHGCSPMVVVNIEGRSVRLRPSKDAGCPEIRGERSDRLDDTDHLAVTLATELDGARGEREQGVVAAAAHTVTGVDLGAALADEDLARADGLAAEALDAEALGVGVTPVLGGADALLRCHLESILVWSRDRSGDARDLQPGQLLAVALALLVAGLVLVAEDADLLATEVLDLLGGDLHLGEVRLRRGDLVTVDQQHGSEI